jgi:type I restriction enzyme S subunit
MGEWKEFKLRDTVDLITGFPFNGNKYEMEGILRVVRGENVTIGTLRWDSEKYWNHGVDNLDNYHLKTDDIVIGMDGSRVGHNRAIIRENELPLILAQRVARLRTKKCFDQKFIWYQIYCKRFISYVEAIQTGTSIPHISPSQINDFEIIAPDYKEQKFISETISSLDEKIDLLHRQNKTLEQLGETLFRHWFVEGIVSEDFISLGDFAENMKNNAKVEDLKKYDHYVGLEHIPKKSISLTSWGTPDDLASNKAIFEVNDILFGKLRSYFHKVVFAPIRGVCSTDILVIRPKKKEWFSFCLFWFFNKNLVDHSDLGSGGTRMPRTNWEIISSYQIPKPTIENIESFDKIVRPKLEKITSNTNQIHTLTKLRDTLLPKLMSGEVRVEG